MMLEVEERCAVPYIILPCGDWGAIRRHWQVAIEFMSTDLVMLLMMSTTGIQDSRFPDGVTASMPSLPLQPLLLRIHVLFRTVNVSLIIFPPQSV